MVLLPGVLVLAWLTAASVAIRTSSRIWLRDWVQRGGRGARALDSYLERPHHLLGAAAAAAAFTVMASGAYLNAAMDHSVKEFALAAVIAVVTLTVFGQLVPAAIARRWPMRLVPVLTPPLYVIFAVVAPLHRVVESLLPRRWRRVTSATDGLQELLREGVLEGVGDRDEITIISGLVQFAEKTVGEIMRPRAEIFALDASLPAGEIAQRIAEAKYTRVPVYQGSLDTVVGMVHAFDLLQASGARGTPPLRPVVQAAVDTPCNELLFRLLRGNTQLAIVRDAADQTAGLVTLEDLLEELVGDIRDEYDEPGAGAA